MKVIYDGSLSSEDLQEEVLGIDDVVYYDNNGIQLLRCKVINGQLLILSVNNAEVKLIIKREVFCRIVHYRGMHIDWSARCLLDSSIILQNNGYREIKV